MKSHKYLTRLFLIAISIIAVASIMHAMISPKSDPQKASALWAQLLKEEQSNKPKSVIVLADKIIEQSQKDRNSIDEAIAWTKKVDATLSIDSDDCEALLRLLQARINECHEAPTASLLHLVAADIYLDYRDRYHTNYHDSAETPDSLAVNLASWSKTQYANVLQKHLSSIKSLSGDSSLLTGSNGQFLFQKRNKTLHSLISAQQRIDYLSMLLYTRAYDNEVFEMPESVRLDSIFVPGLDFIRPEISTGDRHFDSYLRVWRALLQSVDSQSRLFVQLDIERLRLLNTMSLRQVATNIQTKDLYDQLLLQMIEQYKDQEAAIDLLAEYGRQTNFSQPNLEKIVDYLKNTIARFGKSDGIEILKSHLNVIEFPRLAIGASEGWIEGVQDSIIIKAKNIDEAILSVFYSPFPTQLKWLNNSDDTVIKELIKNPVEPLFTEKVNVKAQHHLKDTTLARLFTFDRPGRYLVKLEDAKKRRIPETKKRIETHLLLEVSRYLYYIQSDGQSHEMNVLRGTDGATPSKPIQLQKFNVMNALVSNPSTQPIHQWGTILLDRPQERIAHRILENGIPVTPLFHSYGYLPIKSETKKTHTSSTLHTDRAIYRPGQKVHYKGVISQYNDKQFELTTHKQLQLEVLDPSGKIIYTHKEESSEMGSFTGSFLLPETVMGGNCSFRIDGEHASQFRVEEYKRPTFELSINPIAQTYTFGDTIQISGTIKNYAAISTSGLKVHLSLSKPSTFHRFRVKYPALPASSTTVTTDAEGRFLWKYHLPVSYARFFPDPSYNAIATISALTTDEKGESMETSSQLPLSYTPYSLVNNMPDHIDMGEPTSFTPSVVNRNKEPQSLKVHMQWYHLNSKQLFNSIISANEETHFEFAKQLPKGNYNVKMWIVDTLGRTSEQNHKVYLFDSRNNKLPETLSFYLRQNHNNNIFASFTMATTMPQQHVTIDVFNEAGRVERIRIILSNEIKRVTLPYKPIYGNKPFAYITYVENSLIRNKRFELSAPIKQPSVKLQWCSLRDNMTPNAEEIWILRWIDTTKLTTKAELCVTMYDASLNQFAQLTLPERIKATQEESRFPYFQNSFSYKFDPTFQYTYTPYFNFYYPDQESIFPSSSLNQVYFAFGSSRKNGLTGSTKGILRKQSAPASGIEYMESTQVEDKAAPTNPISELRTELIETALFEPQLRPDKEGYCTLKFRAPQTLTQWAVKAWGYNENGDIARLDTIVATRKQILVQPNLPRFFREGDTPTLIANVANLTEQHQTATVRIRLYTIEGDTLLNHSQAIHLDPKSRAPITASFEVPSSPSQIIYEISATSDQHSDGERHTIPLLRRDVTVHSGEPFFLNGETTQTIAIPDELNHALKSGRLDETQIQIVQNPIFFAVKTLPLILDLSSDNAMAVTHSLFARMMAQHIISNNSEIIALIQSWEKSSEGMTSLQRATQFKLSNIDQTPFFSAINREQEAMRQWSYWINNPSQLENANRAAFEVLKTLQLPDGGFCWFKGGGSSYFFSLRIAKLLTTLSLHGANSAQGEHEMRIKLIGYLDNEITKLIEQTPSRKRNNRYWRSMLTAHSEYLALRANYRDLPFPSSLLHHHKNMIKQIGMAWKNSSLQTQTHLIKIAIAYGYTKEANSIVQSLLEHTKLDQFGRHFPNNRATAMSNTNQLSAQIEFIDALTTQNIHPQEIKEMTQWIFAQYQTQRMFHPVVATQGIDLILRNLETVNPEGSFIVSIKGRTLQPLQKDLKAPVLTYQITANDLKCATLGIQISQSGKAIAWGGLLYNYQSPIDQVQDKTGDLAIQKQYFRSNQDGSLAPINKNQPLHVGEKLIMRYTIIANRDFDYVQIHDLKGAFAEPVHPLSQYKAEGGLWFYSEPKDKATNLFFYFIPKGTYTIDAPVWVNASGHYSIGTASIQSQLSPEFVSFSGALRMKIEQP